MQAEGHDPANWEAALQRAHEFGGRIPIGVLYQVERPTYEEEEPVLQAGPLVKQPLGLAGRESLLLEFT